MVSIKSNVFQPDLDLMHLVVLAIGLSQAGCTDEVCTPGATQVCVCPGGKQGAQHCNSQGTGWERCQCPGGADAGVVDAAPLPDGKAAADRQGLLDGPAKDQVGLDLASPDMKPWPDMKFWPDIKSWPDMKPWPDQCIALCKGEVCGDPDGCGGTCMAGSGCYAPPGTWKTIKAGSFQMGSPSSENCRSSTETSHQVTLTNRFMIMNSEVTQTQFLLVMKYNPSLFSNCGGYCPVEQVNWSEAAAYANTLSAKAGKAQCYTCLGSGKIVSCTEATAFSKGKVYKCPGFRLPTEAEWEYAYRAGTWTAFYSGGISSCTGNDPNLNKIGWYQVNSQVSYAGSFKGRGTHPVGQKVPNAWGLYDMAGNVWEWCHDRFVSYPSLTGSD